MSDGSGVSLGCGGGSVGRGVSLGTAVSGGAVVGTEVRVSVGVRVGRGVDERTGVLTSSGRGTHSLCPIRMMVLGRQLAARSRATVVPVATAMRESESPFRTI